MTIYADVLAVTNLYVDFFLLWAVRRLLGLRVGEKRLALGAAVGAVCALACLVPGAPGWASLLWGAASAALTTAAAFCPLSRRGFLRACLCFWGCSFLLAGAFLFVIQWFAPRDMAVVGHAVYLGISPRLLFFCTLGAYGVLWAGQRLLPREDVSRQGWRLQVEWQGKTARFWAMADTGSSLREPFSGLPVIVCSPRALGEAAPPGLCPPDRLAPGVRLIPFESLGGAGALPAFRPERVLRLPGQEPLDCYVALWEKGFSQEGCQALFNPRQFPGLSP